MILIISAVAIVLLLTIPSVILQKKAIEETRDDLAYPEETEYFDSIKMVSTDKEPIIRNTIPV